LSKPQVKMKVFALGRNELGANSAIVEGTLTVHNFNVNVLIDPGSSHSYINEDRACHLGWDSLDLPYTLLVSALLGKSVEAEKYIPRCVVRVGKEELPGDLIVMPFKDYNLILGMD
jgi:predicted aspartyl protease